MSICVSNLGEELKVVTRPKHLFRMVSFDFAYDLPVVVWVELSD